MKVLDSYWMCWKSFWTRNSKNKHEKKLQKGKIFKHNNIMYFYFLLFRQENIDKKNQHKLIQCLKAFMNNKVSSIYFCLCHKRWQLVQQSESMKQKKIVCSYSVYKGSLWCKSSYVSFKCYLKYIRFTKYFLLGFCNHADMQVLFPN